MNFIGIIPAHSKSKRFPKKALHKLKNKSLIQHGYEKTKKCKLLSDLYVATDCLKIKKEIKQINGKVILTNNNHENGSSRCFEAFKKINKKYDYIINIQSDQPFINSKIIDQMILDVKKNKPSILTTGFKIKEHEIKDMNAVKVYVKNNICINFSRKKICEKNIFKHIGIYFFQSKIIDKLILLKKTKREQNESLEQLRWLQNNYEINFTKSIYNVISINSKQDLLDL